MKKWLLNLLLTRYFRIVNEHELLSTIPKERQEVFKTEAEIIRNTGYWKWFMEDMELLIERKLFGLTSTSESMWFAKGMLYCLTVMEENMKAMVEAKLPVVDTKTKIKMRKFLNK